MHFMFLVVVMASSITYGEALRKVEKFKLDAQLKQARQTLPDMEGLKKKQQWSLAESLYIDQTIDNNAACVRYCVEKGPIVNDATLWSTLGWTQFLFDPPCEAVWLVPPYNGNFPKDWRRRLQRKKDLFSRKSACACSGIAWNFIFNGRNATSHSFGNDVDFND